jgi:tripartite ATP-independent transporter DctP family solute receptor
VIQEQRPPGAERSRKPSRRARRVAAWVIIAASTHVLPGDACSAAESSKVLRLAHGLDPGHPVHQALLHFAAQVEDRTHGALRIRVYPSEQLGNERELVELLQLGTIDFTKVSASVLESFVPEMRLFTLPYLFRDRDHLFRVLDGEIGNGLLAPAGEVRLHALAYFDAGSRSFYTRKQPVSTTDDLAGLKIRTQESASAVRLINSLGAIATPVSWGELYTALSQGVVDGAENNPPSYLRARHYEVAPFYSLDEHTAVPDVLLISQRTWQRLTNDQQDAIAAAATDAAHRQRELWQQATEEAMRELRAAGVTVVTPDKKSFSSRVHPLIEEARRDAVIGEWVGRILELP